MKQFLVLLLILASSLAYAQNGNVKGKVVDTDTKKPIPGATVNIGTYSAITDANGEFEVTNVPNGDYTVGIITENYEAYQVSQNFNFAEGTSFSLPAISLKYKGVQEIGTTEIIISESELDGDDKGQNVSGLLHSSDDIFNKVAGFNLSAGFFRARGYDGALSLVYMNGILTNDAENGRASWSEWGGLNDVMRNKEAIQGLNPCDFSFGSVGGVTNIITRASMQRKQFKVSYSLTNKSYTNRAMITYSTGLMQNGWAFVVSGSRRWSEEGYVPGTFYDAYAYFVGAEKKINQKHSISFTAYGAPTSRGMQAGATQEAYDLVGSHYYNPNWGWQDGKKRSARIRNFHEPMFIMSHYWNVNEKLKLNTSAAYTFGQYGTTSLNWYNSKDPRPDYYRYMPSYQTDPAIAALITEKWKTDKNTQQINWDELYQTNYLSNLEGSQAKYIIEDRRSDHKQFSIAPFVLYELNNNIEINGGLEFTKYKSMNFKVLDDFLGGKFWKDIDQFAERDFSGDTITLQNDMNNPNKLIYEGDKFGYNYDINLESTSAWAQSIFTYNKFDYFVAFKGTQTTFWREGLMKNGRAPLNSLGESEKKSFFNYATKFGITYKVTGRHFLVLNCMYETKAPSIRNSFISPRVKNEFAKDLKSEEIIATEFSYVMRSPIIKARITVFNTVINDQTELQSFYSDVNKTFINYSITGINKIHQGLEFGAEVKATTSISITAIAAVGNYRYTSRPTARISAENGMISDTTEIVYQKGFYVEGIPSTAGSVGINWRAPKFWFLNVNFNYFGERYMDFYAPRRVPTATQYLLPGDPLIKEITEQQKVDDGYTVDISIGKSFRFQRKYFLNLNFSVSNILDNKDLITNGYEQLRFDGQNAKKFPPKYYYAIGRNYFINLAFRF